MDILITKEKTTLFNIFGQVTGSKLGYRMVKRYMMPSSKDVIDYINEVFSSRLQDRAFFSLQLLMDKCDYSEVQIKSALKEIKEAEIFLIYEALPGTYFIAVPKPENENTPLDHLSLELSKNDQIEEENAYGVSSDDKINLLKRELPTKFSELSNTILREAGSEIPLVYSPSDRYPTWVLIFKKLKDKEVLNKFLIGGEKKISQNDSFGKMNKKFSY